MWVLLHPPATRKQVDHNDSHTIAEPRSTSRISCTRGAATYPGAKNGIYSKRAFSRFSLHRDFASPSRHAILPILMAKSPPRRELSPASSITQKAIFLAEISHFPVSTNTVSRTDSRFHIHYPECALVFGGQDWRSTGVTCYPTTASSARFHRQNPPKKHVPTPGFEPASPA